MNLIIYLVPLICIIFGTMYFYNSQPYIEMMLCQPIPRSSLFIGLYFGISIPLVLSFFAGLFLPFLFFADFLSQINLFFILLLILILLTLTFVAIAFCIYTIINDRVKGLSLSIIIWLILSLAFDGILLLTSFIFFEYPVEKILIGLTVLNPVNLARTIFVLNFEASALMGITGAVFKKFFGSSLGTLVSLFSMFLWILLTFLFGLIRFKRKDF